MFLCHILQLALALHREKQELGLPYLLPDASTCTLSVLPQRMLGIVFKTQCQKYQPPPADSS